MIKKLQEVATITAGHYFSKKVQREQGGDYKVLQLRDVGDLEELHDISPLATIDFEGKGKSILEKGDILITTRATSGTGIRTLVYTGEPDSVVASSLFFIVRAKDDFVSKEYLAEYLQTKPALQDLMKLTTGASIKMLLRKRVGELSIPVPSRDTQDKKVAAARVIREQLDRIKSKQEKLLAIKSQIFSTQYR